MGGRAAAGRLWSHGGVVELVLGVEIGPADRDRNDPEHNHDKFQPETAEFEVCARPTPSDHSRRLPTETNVQISWQIRRASDAAPPPCPGTL